jgi:coenzyme F420-0:L-glutamate ligase/coenzyme F420-1:gamma-L-glutamate ligase
MITLLHSRIDVEPQKSCRYMLNRKRELVVSAIPGIPEIESGADLASVLSTCIARAGLELATGDVIVIAQKIVSKAEGRAVSLATVEPSARAHELARETDKDPRLVELMLRESREVLRTRRGALIVEHRLGFVMANAGIDQSNVEGEDSALLLPEDPDASARAIQAGLERTCGSRVGVVINDSFGRAWRNGVAGIAIGVANVAALVDARGNRDRAGRPLRVTLIGAADELASAASLVMGQADEGFPAVIARGFPYALRDSSVRELVRPREEDLFR